MPSQKSEIRRVSIVGSHYSLLQRERITNAIMEDALTGRSGYVCVANVHTTMMGYFDPNYQQITNESRYSVPDGVPLAWAMAALCGEQDRVRGPTLMREICDQGRKAGLKHFLYGGSEVALQALAAYLRNEYPGIEIVGMVSPPFRSLTEQEMKNDADLINTSGAQILWVGLGAPKQERWMWAQRNRVQPIMLGVGAAFDLLPGIIPEAPLALQRLGLEWLYRLYREPRRLWRRYIFNNPMFVLLFGAQLFAAKLIRKKYVLPSKHP